MRTAGEVVGLGGYSVKQGGYLGGILAAGGELGSHENYFGGFTGVEATTASPRAVPISLLEGQVGVEIPFLAGVGAGGGYFSTAEEHGLFFYANTGLLNGNVSVGFGFALP